VVLNGPGAEEQPGADLGVGHALASQPRDLGFLGGEGPRASPPHPGRRAGRCPPPGRDDGRANAPRAGPPRASPPRAGRDGERAVAPHPRRDRGRPCTCSMNRWSWPPAATAGPADPCRLVNYSLRPAASCAYPPAGQCEPGTGREPGAPAGPAVARPGGLAGALANWRIRAGPGGPQTGRQA
jgi:hypothetical protein